MVATGGGLAAPKVSENPTRVKAHTPGMRPVRPPPGQRKGAKMTAKIAGKLAAEGLWTTIKRLRDQWVLIVFAVTALFWARDFYEQFVHLPGRVQTQSQVIEVLRKEIAALDSVDERRRIDRSPVLSFPGRQHGIDDGVLGAPVTVRLNPVHWDRDDCRTADLAAFMVDSTNRWYSVATDLVRLPQLTGEEQVAFGVMVHPRMTVGRAEFLVQITQDCGSHLQVDSSPRLHFRVRAADPG